MPRPSALSSGLVCKTYTVTIGTTKTKGGCGAGCRPHQTNKTQLRALAINTNELNTCNRCSLQINMRATSKIK